IVAIEVGAMFARVRDMVGQTCQPLQRVHGLEVAAERGIHPGSIQHGLLAVEVTGAGCRTSSTRRILTASNRFFRYNVFLGSVGLVQDWVPFRTRVNLSSCAVSHQGLKNTRTLHDLPQRASRAAPPPLGGAGATGAATAHAGGSSLAPRKRGSAHPDKRR